MVSIFNGDFKKKFLKIHEDHLPVNTPEYELMFSICKEFHIFSPNLILQLFCVKRLDMLIAELLSVAVYGHNCQFIMKFTSEKSTTPVVSIFLLSLNIPLIRFL